MERSKTRQREKNPHFSMWEIRPNENSSTQLKKKYIFHLPLPLRWHYYFIS